MSQKHKLSEAQKKMYASEKTMNFRWISKLVASRSSHILTAKDLASLDLYVELAEIGQFAELAYSTVPVGFVFENLPRLVQPDFPLEGYEALQGSILVSEFFGDIARVHVYVAYRPQPKQLIIAISGTATFQQALQDLKAVKHNLSSGYGAAHSGFCEIYKGIKSRTLDGMQKGLGEHDVEEVVITGHSMGGAVAYFLMLDLLAGHITPAYTTKLKLVVFGSPRPGDTKLAKSWQELLKSYRNKNGEDSVTEYSVKGYNDGVPSLPPLALGYRHCSQHPFYLVRGRLYRIPTSQCEYALFSIALDEELDKQMAEHPRGGHNYYNGRDMEKVARRLQWLDKSMAGTDNWEGKYRKHLAKHQKNS